MKSVLTLGIFALSLLLFLNQNVHTYPNKPPTGVSGLTGSANCTSCHNGTVNAGPGKLNLTFSDTTLTYRNDSTYSITVNVTQNAIGTFGHEFAIVDSNYNGIGTLTVTNTTTEYAFNSGGVLYGGHKNANSTNTWIYKWKAPAASAYKGDILIGCSGMAANSNGRTGGDYTYVKNMVIQHAKDSSGSQNGVQDITLAKPEAQWLGNADGYLQISSPVHGQGSIAIFDLSGKYIYQELYAFQQGLQVYKPKVNLTSGIYIVQLSLGTLETALKFGVVE